MLQRNLQKRYPSNVKAVSINASNVEISVDENLHTKSLIKQKKVFGLIGNYKTRYKGLHIAIEAFGNIKEQIGDFEFRILGKGNSNDYKELIEKYSLEKMLYLWKFAKWWCCFKLAWWNRLLFAAKFTRRIT